VQKDLDSGRTGTVRRFSTRTQARFFLLLAVILWGISFPLIKALGLAQQSASPESATFFLVNSFLLVRSLGATAIFLIWSARSLGTISRLEWSQGIGLGVLLGCGLLFFGLGVYLLAASLCAFFLHTAVVIVPLMVAVRDRTRPSARVATSCLLVMAGAALLSLSQQNELRIGRGEIFSIIAAFFFSLHLLWLERPIYVSNRPAIVALIMVGISTLVFIPPALAESKSFSQTWGAFAAGNVWIFLGPTIVFCTVIPYLLMLYWQARLPAVEAVIIYAMEPIFASISALWLPAWFSRLGSVHYPNESLAWNLLIGGGLITGANILIALQPKSKSPS
jgi:drug/metabolite transporter (DMT)-like permease